MSVLLSLCCGSLHAGADVPIAVHVDWDETIAESRATPTLQVIPNAMTRKGEPFHGIMYSAIRTLDAKYVRFLPWGPYPYLQIPALRAPTAKKTYWDFTHIDPQITAFFAATRGKEPFVNFSSIPPWMLTDFKQYTYPKDPHQMDWAWIMPTSADPRAPRGLKDPTGKQLAEYYARIVSWYTNGGFIDENGRFHRSGHKFRIPWWGVLNEHDYMLSAQDYTKVYDAIVSEIRKVSPSTKFLALEMVGTDLPKKSNPDYFEYFLNPKHHAPGVPIDMMAYHFYAHGGQSERLDTWQHTFFSQADAFLREVDYIEAIRKRLSPETKVYVDELGSQVPESTVIPPEYWNLSAGLFAYLYAELVKRDVDAVGQAGFLFYPGNFASVTMMDWNTGKLNARFHVLKLLKDHFGAGDRLKRTTVADNIWLPSTEDVYAQGFETARGRKVLLVNKRSSAKRVAIKEQGDGKVSFTTMSVVDSVAGFEGVRRAAISANEIELKPFAVAVLSQEETHGDLSMAPPSRARSAERMFEADFESKKVYENPFIDVDVDVVFTRKGKSWRVPAFWRGGSRWSVRFAPAEPGRYAYRLESTDRNNSDLNGRPGTVDIAAYRGTNALLRRGNFRVSANQRYFEQADGTPFFWLGDTVYTGFSDRLPWEGFKKLTDDRKAKGFTALHMAVMACSNEETAPTDAGFCNEGGCVWDEQFRSINPHYFDYADRRVQYAVDAGLAPVLFGAWRQTLQQMGLPKMKKYWRHLIARYGAYPVFWVAGGEIYDPPGENVQYATPGWTDVVRYIRAIDPYHHPLSAHEPPPAFDTALQDETLTDFDLFQPSHFGWASIAAEIAQLNLHYARTAIRKPLIVGEVGWETLGGAHQEDFQRAAFWLAMVNGAAGFAYGNAITGESYSVEKPLHRVRLSLLTWEEAMQFPSTRQLGLGATALQRYPWQRFAPHPEWVTPRGTTLLAPQEKSTGFDIDLVNPLFEQVEHQDFAQFCAQCPRGVWQAHRGNFQLPYVAGIPGEIRLIYIPSRGGYDGGTMLPPTVLQLEEGVRYRVSYFDPTLGVTFDLGRVERPVPGAVLHQEDFVSTSAWVDQVGSGRLRQGQLFAAGETLATLEDIHQINAVAAVDIRTDADAALVLRYQDSGNYLAAIYSAKERMIFIRERRAGIDGAPLGSTKISSLAPSARLSAEVRDGTAIVSILVGKVAVTSSIVDIKSVEGDGVGLMHGGAGAAQFFDNYVVRKSPTLIQDGDLSKKLYDAQGRYRGELKGPGWDDYGKEKHILLDAYRPERLPFPQDWLLVLEAI